MCRQGHVCPRHRSRIGSAKGGAEISVYSPPRSPRARVAIYLRPLLFFFKNNNLQRCHLRFFEGVQFFEGKQGYILCSLIALVAKS
jgi:hypothetical protein